MNWVVNKFILCSIYWYVRFGMSDDILGCGGFVKSEIPINFSLIEIKLYTKQGALKYHTDCAPNNGYYLIPLYEKGEFVLQVEPPNGWNLEPKEVKLQIDGQNDPCSRGQDINFYFKGFSINGKVVSRGHSNGPSGVTIYLKKDKSDTILQTATTAEDGQYSFSNVLPALYTLQVSHPKWKFEVPQIKVDVSSNIKDGPGEFRISGYDVRGEVSSDGEPIKGINFLLFGKGELQVEDCIKKPLEGFNNPEVINPLCYVVSDSNGEFVFPVLVPGQYTVVPFYKKGSIQFDVRPSRLDFAVGHNSLVLEKKFKVQGFSVIGRVLAYENGPGIAEARVILSDRDHTETQKDGTFVFDGMKAGIYSVQVLKEKYFFEPLEVKITPHTPQLPPIIVVSFEICGQLQITKLPPGLDLSARRLLIIESVSDPKKPPVKIRTNGNGQFCSPVTRGKFKITPMVAEAESKAGLKFQPFSLSLTVNDIPVSDLNFKQFLASVSGKIKCLSSCAGTTVTLEPIARGLVEPVTLILFDKDQFTFNSVLPSQYRIRVAKEDWCWKKTQVEFSVDAEDANNIEFFQEGYIMNVIASHQTDLHYSTTQNVKGTFKINQGPNALCLNEPGVYELVPEGCHIFTEKIFKFNTEKPSPVVLQATYHSLTGTVLCDSNVTDLSVETIITSRTGEEKNEVLTEFTITTKEKMFLYKFKLWVQPGDVLKMEPHSSLLLFDPPIQHVTTVDTCMDDFVKFDGKMGLFISGKVVPPLEGVEIFLQTADDANGTNVATTKTDKNGRYTVGPLRNQDYLVDAQKKGYVLTRQDKFDFGAFKLAEIAVEVVNAAGQGVSGVLLSLSGTSDYRKNSLTFDDGRMNFLDLEPGQYFLRPMLKEFNFDPSSSIIDVKEGITVNIKLKGTRIAFSCYGNITSLTGEPEPGVTIEAVGINTCRTSQEEATSDAEGTFRIRGLLPGCRYQVKVKKNQETVQNLERATPVAKTLMVDNSDLTGIHMIVFRRPTQMEITGNVIVDSEFLNTLKVKLLRDESMDHVVHTVSLSHGHFFQIPFIPLDGRTYTLRLESSLSRSTFHYTLPQVVIKANTSYEHVTFTFSPQPKGADHEMQQGSNYAFPLAILVILLTCGYYKQLLPLSSHVAEFVHGIFNPVNNTVENASSAEALERRKKIKSKKI